jgi:hypothetical protein
MRFRNEDRATIERTGTALVTLLERGDREVSIEKVLGWLGYSPAPQATQPAGPPPGVDPLTGCLPVTPGTVRAGNPAEAREGP